MSAPKAVEETPRIIGKTTGVSLALVVVIVGGIVANLGMMSTLNERVSGFGINLTNQGDDIGEIKSSVRDLSTSTRSELAEMRRASSDLRERVTKLEALIAK